MIEFDKFVSEILDPRAISQMRLLMVLKDGKGKTWKELERETGVSTKTLSLVLKELIDMGVVRRKVVQTFPPKSFYFIRDDKILRMARLLENDQFIKLILKLASNKPLDHTSFIAILLDYLHRHLYTTLVESLAEAKKYGFPPEPKEQPSVWMEGGEREPEKGFWDYPLATRLALISLVVTVIDMANLIYNTRKEQLDEIIKLLEDKYNAASKEFQADLEALALKQGVQLLSREVESENAADEEKTQVKTIFPWKE